VRSHRFPGANTWNAEYHGLDEQRLQTQAFLRDRVALSVLPPRVHAGKADLTVLVANRGVGHDFPTGTVDLHDLWLEVAVRDATGRLLMESGALDEQGRGAPGAHRYGSLLLDGRGRPIDRHNLWDARKVVYERRIPAGGVDLARYRFALPAATRWPLRVAARLHLRKFAPAFHDFSFPEGVVTPLSTVTLTSLDTRVAVDAAVSAGALLDWGIGLLLEGRAVDARPVLEDAVKAEPGSVDAWLALSRACREAGDAGRALMAAEKAAPLSPRDPRVAHARGLAGEGARVPPQPDLPRATVSTDAWLRAHPDAALEGAPGHVHGE